MINAKYLHRLRTTVDTIFCYDAFTTLNTDASINTRTLAELSLLVWRTPI